MKSKHVIQCFMLKQKTRFSFGHDGLGIESPGGKRDGIYMYLCWSSMSWVWSSLSRRVAGGVYIIHTWYQIRVNEYYLMWWQIWKRVFFSLILLPAIAHWGLSRVIQVAWLWNGDKNKTLTFNYSTKRMYKIPQKNKFIDEKDYSSTRGLLHVFN